MSRLKFSLSKVRIEPLVHLRILRHASQSNEKQVNGHLFGSYADRVAEITNIMPIYEDDREEMTSRERKFQENLHKFNYDKERIGWYCVEHKKNFWSNIEQCIYYEEQFKTGFLLVFDYNVSQAGGNPYKAYRLKHEFATKENFTWSDLTKFDDKKNLPFDQIEVEIIRNPLAEALLQFNKKFIFDSFEQNERSLVEPASKRLETTLKNYNQNIQNRLETLSLVTDNFVKVKEQLGQKRNSLLSRPIDDKTYYSNLSGNLILSDMHRELSSRQKNQEQAYRLLLSLSD